MNSDRTPRLDSFRFLFMALYLCRQPVLNETDHVQHGDAAKSLAGKVVDESLAAEFIMFIRLLIFSYVLQVVLLTNVQKSPSSGLFPWRRPNRTFSFQFASFSLRPRIRERSVIRSVFQLKLVMIDTTTFSYTHAMLLSKISGLRPR